MLEVIDKGQSTPAHPVPIVFVHGAFHGAWCWDEHFLDFFAAEGYRAVAFSLRGHGRSTTPTSLKRCSIADYVDDLDEVVTGLPTPPILVGHSMGGFIIQKYLETRSVPAAVLAASTPPVGQHAALVKLSLRQPWRALRATLTGRPSVLFDTVPLARKNLFSSDTAEDVVMRTHLQLREESPRALLADMSLLDLVQTSEIDTPMLVIGGGQDALYSRDVVRSTARAYGTTEVMIPDVAHDMMLDTHWAGVARTIARWLGERNL